ncbi:hypothetical protein JCM11641_004778 [Rhodosporidiobolus odoratus]
MAKSAKNTPTTTARPRRAAVAASPYGTSTPTKPQSPAPNKNGTVPKKRGRPPKVTVELPVNPQEVETLEQDQDTDEPLTPLDDDEAEEDQEIVVEDASIKEDKPAKVKENSICPVCTRKGGQDALWVECDNLVPPLFPEIVLTFVPGAPTAVKSGTLDHVDKFYCPTCTTTSATTANPLHTTYKPNGALPSRSGNSTPSGTRKSQRTTRSKNIDYANLDQHLPANVDRWAKVIAQREEEGKIVNGLKSGAFKSMKASELTDEWIFGEEGMKEPFVVEEREGLGMEMPHKGFTVREVAELVGPQTPLEVIDCASQSSLNNWNLGQWADYYEDPEREKVRNVISLEVSETELGRRIKVPEVVRKIDWVDNVWPSDMKKQGEYPRVQKYCLMSVERCWTDWHVDFAGSSVFYHVLRGGKTFYFIRPTPANLAAYEKWSGSSERQEDTWLGDEVDMVYKLELKAGWTAFIPTGWVHAVYTPSDSLVIGGNFLHSLNIPTQLRIYQIELATKVPRKFRFPHFVRLLWLVAWHYLPLLKAHLPAFPTGPSPPLTPTDPGPQSPPKLSLPPHLGSPRVLEGLRQLSTFLIEQTTRFAPTAQVSAERRRLARENIPWKKVTDPVKLSREFRKAVMMALGEDVRRDREAWMEHVAFMPADEDAAKMREQEVAMGQNGETKGVKRKADSMEGGREGSMAPPPPVKSARIKHANVIPSATTSFAVTGGLSMSALPLPPTGYTPSASSSSYTPPAIQPVQPQPPHSVVVKDTNGSIIGRQTVPLVQTSRMEDRIDPCAYPATGARQAEVRESRSTQSVVRRWENDPTDANGRGGAVVETRTVITIVERVKFPSQVPFSPYDMQQQQSSSTYGTNTGAVPDPQSAFQPQGVGPPYPPALPPGAGSTLTRQQQDLQLHVNAGASTNPSPYPAYGYPYHYNLAPFGSGSAAGGAGGGCGGAGGEGSLQPPNIPLPPSSAAHLPLASLPSPAHPSGPTTISQSQAQHLPSPQEQYNALPSLPLPPPPSSQHQQQQQQGYLPQVYSVGGSAQQPHAQTVTQAQLQVMNYANGFGLGTGPNSGTG